MDYQPPLFHPWFFKIQASIYTELIHPANFSPEDGGIIDL
jgi:hypothetical protein